MKMPFAGAIDCDLHPAVPSTAALVPYLDPVWRDQVTNRYIDRMGFGMLSFPAGSPKMCRPDWRPAKGLPGSEFAALQKDALDAYGLDLAICNVFHGTVTYHNEDLAAAFVRAVNRWTAAELLDSDPRLRASILVTPQNPDHAVAEIERCAADGRFVQVLLLAQNELMLGRRILWPIYAAAERHGLAVGIHAGGMYRSPTTAIGWPSYQVEDYIVQTTAFQNQLVSLVTEGVFAKFPALKVVFLESGCTWIPSWMWRMDKTWRGARPETPWVDRHPSEIVRDHVRFSLQPFDAPPGPAAVERLFEQVKSDEMFLFATDYPHWQFDRDEVLPDGIPEASLRRVLIDNALATYPRLGAGRAAVRETKGEHA